MPRSMEALQCPDIPQNTTDSTMRTLQLELELITPMFGGGVLAGEADPVTLIRVPSIRGQLRFWWRATRGAAYASPEKLFQAEKNIWGSTDKPSAVSLWVQPVKYVAGDFDPCAETSLDKKGKARNKIKSEYPEYALFPFQGNPGDPKDPKKTPPIPIGKGLKKCNFKLDVRVDACGGEEYEQDVRCALWAWINFGGLGARTRRGCGSLFCKEFAPPSCDLESFKKWLEKKCEKYECIPASGKRKWPVWFDKLLVKEFPKSFDAWKSAIGLLKKFRQGADEGRNPGQGSHSGRSRWPEAESIRECTKKRDDRHGRQGNMSVPGFPRAAFGLPLIFRFKDDGDPQETQLLPVGHSRMASPLFIKPIQTCDGRSLACVLLLRTPELTQVELRETKASKKSLEIYSDSEIVNKKFPENALSPLNKRSSDGNALEAFLAFAKESGFKEVAP